VVVGDSARGSVLLDLVELEVEVGARGSASLEKCGKLSPDSNAGMAPEMVVLPSVDPA